MTATDLDDDPPVAWLGVLGAGQSLGMGVGAPLVAETNAVPGAYKLGDARPWREQFDLANPASPTLLLEPLTEPIHAVHPEKLMDQSYPWNIAGKTPHSSMAATLRTLAQRDGFALPPAVHSCVAHSGQALSRISKDGDTNAYAGGLYEARAIRRLAPVEYAALVMTHGETDAMLGNREYSELLVDYFDDHKRDLASITGQTKAPVMILSQQNTSPPSLDADVVAQAQWTTQRDHADMICSGPKYQYGYVDGLHLDGPGYDRLGEKYGQVLYKVVKNESFTPLSPTRIAVAAREITIEFAIPYPPLAWDEHLPLARHYEWRHGHGFQVSEGSDGDRVEIVHAVIDGASVRLALARDVHNPTVSYAMYQDRIGMNGGRVGGRSGHLRDSDPLVVSSRSIEVFATRGVRHVLGNFKGCALYDICDPGDYALIHVEQWRATLNRYETSKPY